MATNAGNPKQEELLNKLRLFLSKSEVSDENKLVIKRFLEDAAQGNLKSLTWKLLGAALTGRIDHHWDESGRTALIIAIHEGNTKDVELLTALGANLEEHDNYGNTALMWAILQQKWDLATTLIRLNANVKAVNPLQQTLVHMAARFGNVECINNLVASGANLEEQDIDGDTPLMWAIFEKKWAAVTAMISLNAKVNTSHMQQILVYMAEDLGIKNSTDINLALMYAIQQKKWDAASVLIKLKADLNVRNKDGYTPRMLLAIVDDSEIAQLKKAGIEMLDDDDRIKAKEEYRQHQRMIEERKQIKKNQSDIQAAKSMIKEAGHILGFTSTIAGIRSTGMGIGDAYGLLKRCLSSNPSSMFRTNDLAAIQETLDLTIGYSKINDIEDKVTGHKHLIANYMAGKPTILPVHWAGHVFTLIAWNDVLVICNRGEGHLEKCISVFKIPDEKCTQNGITQFIETIMPINKTLSKNVVLNGIHDFVGDFEKPILTFDSEDQKHGTCAFVNLKSSLLPLLFFMKLLQPDGSEPIALKKFNSTFLQLYLKEGPLAKVLQEIKSDSRIQYKEITEAIRDWEVDILCTAFRLCPTAEERKIYLEIFSAYFNEHYGQSLNSAGHPRSQKKITAEKNRIEKIIKAITFLGAYEQDSDITEMMLSAARAGQWIAVKVLAEHGANMTNLGTIMNTLNKQGDTPLMQASIDNQWPTVSALLHLKANVNIRARTGDTALINAATAGDVEYIISLVRAGGAQLEIKGFLGRTALMNAVLSNQLAAVNTLIDLGADVHAIDTNGDTALSLAKRNKNPVIQNILRNAMKTTADKQSTVDPYVPAFLHIKENPLEDGTFQTPEKLVSKVPPPPPPPKR